MLDEVNEDSILKTGRFPPLPTISALGIALSTSPTAPLSRSDLVAPFDGSPRCNVAVAIGVEPDMQMVARGDHIGADDPLPTFHNYNDYIAHPSIRGKVVMKSSRY